MGKEMRLDKFLADAGAGTRSEVKKLIQKGKVQVNKETVRRPEQKVSAEDQVTLEGSPVGRRRSLCITCSTNRQAASAPQRTAGTKQ